MTTSKKQIEANRQNAQKSTGPKTDEGKAAASQNAVKNGLHARDVVVTSPHLRESRTDYELLYESLCDELQPFSIFQDFLIRKIANCLWRSRRVVSAETAHINQRLDKVNREFNYELRDKSYFSDDIDEEDYENITESEQQALDNIIGVMSLPDDDDSRQILRYEMRLDRQLTRAFNLLRRLQNCRKNESENEKTKGTPKNNKTNPFPCNL